MLARSPAPPPAVIRTVIPLRVNGTPGTTAPSLDIHPNGIGASLAISHDGRTLAYLMRTGETSRLYVRRLEQLGATTVEESDGATRPIFAPDGQSLGFVRDGALYRAALTGGAPTRMADGIDDPRGIDWCGDELSSAVLSAAAFTKSPLALVPRPP